MSFISYIFIIAKEGITVDVPSTDDILNAVRREIHDREISSVRIEESEVFKTNSYDVFENVAEICDDIISFKSKAVLFGLGYKYMELMDYFKKMEFKDFCTEAFERKIINLSSDSPVIVLLDECGYFDVGTLEHFLRLPDFTQNQYQIWAVCTRHE